MQSPAEPGSSPRLASARGSVTGLVSEVSAGFDQANHCWFMKLFDPDAPPWREHPKSSSLIPMA